MNEELVLKIIKRLLIAFACFIFAWMIFYVPICKLLTRIKFNHYRSQVWELIDQERFREASDLIEDYSENERGIGTERLETFWFFRDVEALHDYCFYMTEGRFFASCFRDLEDDLEDLTPKRREKFHEQAKILDGVYAETVRQDREETKKMREEQEEWRRLRGDYKQSAPPAHSHSSSSGKTSGEDRYGASDFHNAEDFYDEHRDSFFDYYDAEKYYNDHK